MIPAAPARSELLRGIAGSPGVAIGKAVVFFLFDYAEGDTADHDDEVEEVRWIGLDQARTALSHAAEREMVELAITHLRKDR